MRAQIRGGFRRWVGVTALLGARWHDEIKVIAAVA
jgi:hypothetical protein